MLSEPQEDLMDRKDWVLLALAAAPEKTLQPVQLQKSLFLVWKRIHGIKDEFYSFTPYHYGPFSKEVYHDADQLATEGMVLVIPQFGTSWSKYSLSSEGEKRVDILKGVADPQVSEYLAKAVQWAAKLSFRQLVSAIYEAYPDYRANSVFQG